MEFFVDVVGLELGREPHGLIAEVGGLSRVGTEALDGGGRFFVEDGNRFVFAWQTVDGRLQPGEFGGKAREDAVLAGVVGMQSSAEDAI